MKKSFADAKFYMRLGDAIADFKDAVKANCGDRCIQGILQEFLKSNKFFIELRATSGDSMQLETAMNYLLGALNQMDIHKKG